MYFMPIIVGFSAGKVFGMNPYTAAVIGAAMLYPKLAAFVGAEETLTFFGLKVTMLDYSQTMLPILLAVFVASWIEKAAKKINLTTLGYCPVNAILGLTVWALAGVALGYALKVKDGETRATAFGTMASALCGITEPVIYTVALTNFKRFICAFVGGGVAGVIGGILGIKFYTWGGDGIFRIPSMINPAGLDISFWGFLICAAIAFVVSAIGSYAVTSADEKA